VNKNGKCYIQVEMPQMANIGESIGNLLTLPSLATCSLFMQMLGVIKVAKCISVTISVLLGWVRSELDGSVIPTDGPVSIWTLFVKRNCFVHKNTMQINGGKLGTVRLLSIGKVALRFLHRKKVLAIKINATKTSKIAFKPIAYKCCNGFFNKI